MKRTLLCAVLALSLLLTAGCGSQSASSSTPAASSGAVSSGTADTIPEFEVPDYSIGLLDNGFYEGVTALDHVTLPALEGIVIPKDIQTVAEEDVQAEIDAMLESYAYTEEIRDRAVKDGDLVNIDYVGRVDGVAFDGGNTQGAGTTVTAGSSEYVDDFLTQIIGAKPGDTVMVEVTFPTPYTNADLAGKDAVFETVINYIVGDTITPELTDAFVQEKLQESYGYASVAEMKEDIRQVLRKDQVTVYVLEELYANCSFSQVPEKLVDDQCEFMRTELSNVAYYNNATLSVVLNYYGWNTLEEAYAANRADFLMYAEQYLMCQAVAEKLDMVVDDAAIENYFATVVGGSRPAVYISYYGKGYVARDVLVDMVTNYLLDNAVYQ